MCKTTKIDIWAVAPGERASGILETASYREGIKVGIPVIVVCGKSDGPVLTVLAAQHGRELNGIEAIRRAILQIDPSRLRGRAIFIPCANPMAVRMRQQDFPHEYGRYRGGVKGFNLNRVWPGSADGTLYEQMANVMWTEAISRSAICIDLHGWTGTSGSLSWGSLRDADMVRAFGLDIHMIKPDAPPGGIMLEEACRTAGVCSITAELVPQNTLSEDAVAAGTRGILNVMKKAGMLEGTLDLPPVQIELDDGKSEPHREHILKASFPGLLVPRVFRMPTLVKKGDLLAELVDLDDVQHVEPIVSPIDGAVFNVNFSSGGEDMVETNVKEAGDIVALVKSYRRCIRNS